MTKHEIISKTPVVLTYTMSRVSVCSCGGADLVGVCVIGRQYGGQSRDHWFSMLDRPRKAVAQWYPLTDHVPWSQTDYLSAGLAGNASEPTVHLPASETN